ncbi:PulJ/GspJ family protein [Pseudomonas sp. SST3]|uniref:PulJ/GspJ family protein n=1 Tax=Pseudomonas sp. SST3 TaxID=2267882 RepID=UPI001443ABEE|nr:type II secretion system protein [Pseudomonas sp. SST3]NKQ11417.1 prepilin-type N-terminal cleavage/methylation domain-containing protein [Pseudomonas sp. SST3]
MSVKSRGFTLVELIMVIALAGLVAVMISTVLSGPMESFTAQSRRAALVDLGAGALQRMARDVRLAVPNSLRVTPDGQAFELLLIHSAGRYRPNRNDSEGLRFDEASANCGSTTADASCDSVQVLTPSLDLSGARWLVLYNVGAQSGAAPVAGPNAWAGGNPGVITPTGTTFALRNGAPAGESLIALGNLPAGGFRFAFASPQRRLYLAEHVVGYRCQNGQLIRYSYSELLASLPSTPPPGSAPRLLAGDVSQCQFSYRAGTAQRSGLLSLSLGMTQAGETLQLIQQVHVDNAP